MANDEIKKFLAALDAKEVAPEVFSITIEHEVGCRRPSGGPCTCKEVDPDDHDDD